MNKLFLIVLLAICLVSANAFVKRDAPEGEDYVKSVQNQINELAKIFADKVKESFDNEALMKNFAKFGEAMNKAVLAQFKRE